MLGISWYQFVEADTVEKFCSDGEVGKAGEGISTFVVVEGCDEEESDLERIAKDIGAVLSRSIFAKGGDVEDIYSGDGIEDVG
jgi:hypothetical protein